MPTAGTSGMIGYVGAFIVNEISNVVTYKTFGIEARMIMNQHAKISDLKNSAKGYLEGSWRTPVLATFLLSAILFILELLFVTSLTYWLRSGARSGTSSLFAPSQGSGVLYYVLLFLFSFLLGVLSTLLQIGGYFLLLNIVSRQSFSVSDLFFAFRRDLGRSATVAVALSLIPLLCLLPYYIFNYLFQQYLIPLWAILMIFSLIVGIAVYIPATLSLSMAPLLLLDFPQYNASDILQHSVQIMNGNKGRLFLLELSFLPLNLLCVFSFGLGTLWVMPYMQMTMALFYLDIMKQQTVPMPS